ncbi:MAG: dihydrodipicolinate synthase family protein [Promethearchaeota archaeon]
MCNTLTFYNQEFQMIKSLNSLLIRHILTNDANSLLLFGSMGDENLFSTAEKLKLIETVSEITRKKCPLLIGIYGNQVDDILNQIENLGKKFEDLSFMITPPTSEKRSAEDINSYFENILGSLTSKNHIFLVNNPPLFAGNEIDPNLLKNLIEFSNLKGLNDSFYNIKNCKAYIQNLSNNFTVICGKEENSQTFLQLIPVNMRKYSGILSNLSNIVNLCSKLYNFAIEDNILELLQIQEQINDIRTKIYEVKTSEIKEKIGLKYAFLHLYKDLISHTDSNCDIMSTELLSQIDTIKKERIEATVNFLLNQKQIYQLYYLGKKDLYQFDEIIKAFSNVEVLVNQGKVKKIKGPYITDFDTLYRVNFENGQLVFRFRTSQSLHYANLIKEKILYPFLDKSLNPNDIDLNEKVKEIIARTTGSYFFKKENPPIIPVSNLVYYDETKEAVPYIFSVQEYIRGKPLFQLINRYIGEAKNIYTKKFLELFDNLGEHLGRLHQVKFNSFYKDFKTIGKKEKLSYSEYFENELEERLQEAKKNKIDFCDEIRDYYRDRISLIEDENEFVLLHNDFKSQNIIVKEELGTIKINGIVDFDKWFIGSRAQDFIKIDYWILKPLNNLSFYNSFYNAYSKFYTINKDFEEKIKLYKLFWLLNEYNFESELIRKSDRIDIIKVPSKTLENYLFEIKAIIR